MGDLGRGDVLLLLIVGYIAITTLVRMMTRRRDALVSHVQHQVDKLQEHRRREVERLKKQQQKDAA